jgi:hypothetical protein
VARYVALSLVLVFTVASGRTLACEWVCDESEPAQASESCQHGSVAGAESQLIRAHPCDLDGLAITFAAVKTGVTGRFATIASAMATPRQLDRIRLATSQLRTSPPGALPSSRTLTSVLRV